MIFLISLTEKKKTNFLVRLFFANLELALLSFEL